MGFKIYKNSSLKEHKPPIVHQEVDLSDINKVMEVIKKQRENQGVLVYANGQVFEELKKVEDFEVVTQETSDEELRSMGLKKDNKYRVKLISKSYGSRGLDYRSIENKLGIYLIVLSPSASEREWLQLLNRVGRYKEECLRIFNSKV